MKEGPEHENTQEKNRSPENKSDSADSVVEDINEQEDWENIERGITESQRLVEELDRQLSQVDLQKIPTDRKKKLISFMGGKMNKIILLSSIALASFIPPKNMPTENIQDFKIEHTASGHIMNQVKKWSKTVTYMIDRRKEIEDALQGKKEEDEEDDDLDKSEQAAAFLDDA